MHPVSVRTTVHRCLNQRQPCSGFASLGEPRASSSYFFSILAVPAVSQASSGAGTSSQLGGSYILSPFAPRSIDVSTKDSRVAVSRPSLSPGRPQATSSASSPFPSRYKPRWAREGRRNLVVRLCALCWHRGPATSQPKTAVSFPPAFSRSEEFPGACSHCPVSTSGACNIASQRGWSGLSQLGGFMVIQVRALFSCSFPS